MEFVEGRTLDLLIAEGLTLPKALRLAVSLADGIARAHAVGVVHRDLKPSNVAVTAEGTLKVLDFGLAKLLGTEDLSAGELGTATTDGASLVGSVVGTPGYMSPEQVSGGAVDFRCDIFAFGAVLYEMVTGQRAFAGATAAQRRAAVLRDQPRRPSDLAPGLPRDVDRVILRCLCTEPERRFQSMLDVKIELLEIQEQCASPSTPAESERSAERQWPPLRTWAWRMAALATIMGAIAGAFVFGRGLAARPVPTYRQVTFRRGFVDTARFASDGQTIAYSARWDGRPSEVLVGRLDLAEPDALSLARDALLRSLRGGEVLVQWQGGPDLNQLARIPLTGGTPRAIGADVGEADWGPSGELAVVRSQDVPRERCWLEYPAGRPVFEAPEGRHLRDVRVSPKGDRVAFILGENGSGGGDIVTVDRGGHSAILSAGWMEAAGLAWSGDGGEVWFTAGGSTRDGVGSLGMLRELRAVSRTGKERLLLRMAGTLTLYDVSSDGRALVSRGSDRIEARGKLAGDESERDLSYLDGTYAVGISDDGKAVLIQEMGQAGGPRNTAYLRRVGEPTPVRLGEGTALALSPDGAAAAVTLAVDTARSHIGMAILLKPWKCVEIQDRRRRAEGVSELLRFP